MTDIEFNAFLANARAALLAERTPGGFWVGELSASALSTATAVFALDMYGDPKYTPLVRNGLRWLAENQNADGGWGDTTKSFSNISTTCLCWGAFAVPEATGFSATVERAESWIRKEAGTLGAKPLAKKVADRYGKDRTFSVPILTMLALAGRLGNDPWKLVPQLPFELAALPFWCFQILQLPVVSYALPALIAIGQVKHAKRPTWNPITRFFRWLTRRETLRKLREIQPTTGGYLEAAPLTSFVAMSLIGAGQADHEVVTHALRFLEGNVRPDGSWPIDTNLSTWVTTLAANAMGGVPDRRQELREWLLKQQYRTVHLYTQAAPGGWAWTDLSGGVPDADDTAGALLALAKLGEPDDATLSAAAAGVTWLLDLQNADGGVPTFCKGWTGLPFDRSSNDLTAHALRAWAAWRPHLPPRLQKRIDDGTRRGLAYLLKTQRPDGAWEPLWFGNQHSAEVANLTYGTSRVLLLVDVPGLTDTVMSALRRGAGYLFGSQNADGGWGGRSGTPSSIEETALAVESLVARGNLLPPPLVEGRSPRSGGRGVFRQPAPLPVAAQPTSPQRGEVFQTSTTDRQPNIATSPDVPSPLAPLPHGRGGPEATRGVAYLATATRNGTHFPPSPIGFYFANLWYFETLYPVIDTVAALTRFANLRATEVPPS